LSRIGNQYVGDALMQALSARFYRLGGVTALLAILVRGTMPSPAAPIAKGWR
jgi:hypothetical protein